jgi:hypothetical protein
VRIGRLVWDLHSRGVIVEPAGDMLAVDPIEKLEPAELEAIREFKQEILSFFASGRFRLVECPGNACGETLLVMDGESYCHSQGMSVRFVDRAQ